MTIVFEDYIFLLFYFCYMKKQHKGTGCDLQCEVIGIDRKNIQAYKEKKKTTSVLCCVLDVCLCLYASPSVSLLPPSHFLSIFIIACYCMFMTDVHERVQYECMPVCECQLGSVTRASEIDTEQQTTTLILVCDFSFSSPLKRNTYIQAC